jgi:uncharacterized membrane protein YcjF (UPF0283 family)
MSTGRGRKTITTVIGALAILVGLLWVGQGLNLIPGSFMTGDPKWFVIGACVVLAGVLLVLVGRSSVRNRRP